MRKILEKGIQKCLPFFCLGNDFEIGSLLTMAGVDKTEKNDESRNDRYQFLINGDGTIRPKKADKWRGLVLGRNDAGDIILTNHCNQNERLQLSKYILKSLPINGYPCPKSKPFPLLLKGKNDGKAIVRSKENKNGTWCDNHWFRLILGEGQDAVMVHFEADGAIRFADKPEQGFDCAHGRHDPGTEVNSYQFQDSPNHRFVRNEDDTISPKMNPDVILSIGKDTLEFRDKKDVKLEDRLLFDIPHDIGYAKEINESSMESKDSQTCEAIDSNWFPLLLDNPVGKAIGVDILRLSEDQKSYFGDKKDLDQLSKFKLVLVEEPNAAKAKIDVKHSVIEIMKNNAEVNAEDDNNGKIEVPYLIRNGCWN